MKLDLKGRKFCIYIRICVITLLCVSMLCTGCAGSVNTENVSATANEADNANQADTSYDLITAKNLLNHGIELPKSDTKVYVNQSGYVVGREKLVYFSGEAYGEKFNIRRVSDDEIVYSAKIEALNKGNAGNKDTDISGQNEEKKHHNFDETLAIGIFTDFDEVGEYYIETDVIGQSYKFNIAQDTYEQIFMGLLKNISEEPLQDSAQGVCDVSFGMHILLHSLECNGSLYEEAYKHIDSEYAESEMIPQLLYIAKWLMSRQAENGSVYDSYEATAAFCGIINMCRDNFGKYDKTIADEYQSAVKKAWEWLELSSCSTEEEKYARFYAATQLYSSENNEKYGAIIDDFLKNYTEAYTKNRFVYYGVLTYLSIERNLDRDMCTHIMQSLVDDTEKICNAAIEDKILGIGKRGIQENLDTILLMGLTNYLTPNKEYTVIIENSIQYMGGLNEEGKCYLGKDGIWINSDYTAQRNLEWTGIMLFGFSDMLKNFSDMQSETLEINIDNP